MGRHTKKKRLDKYYELAKEQGYRARSAYKLIQMNKKYGFLNNAQVTLDLCAAPGGWMQVARKYMPQSSTIIGVDLVPIRPIRGTIALVNDITTASCRAEIRKHLKGAQANVVLCDGAPNVGASWAHDAFVQSDLSLAALKLATEHLVEGGVFITKVFRSKDYNALYWACTQFFKKVEATKPAASRNVSPEIFLYCSGYLAPRKIDPKLLDPKYIFESVDEPLSGKKLDPFSSKKARKRSREGYEDDLTGVMHRRACVTDFVDSEQPVAIVATYNELSFDAQHHAPRRKGGAGDGDGSESSDDSEASSAAELRADLCALYEQHPSTTDEVRELLKDVKLLSKSAFRKLMKWREKMLAIKEAYLAHQASGGGGDEGGGEVAEIEEDSEERVDQELHGAMEWMNKKERKKRRKLMAKKRKLRDRNQLNMGVKFEVDQAANEGLFVLPRKRDVSRETLEEIVEHGAGQELVPARVPYALPLTAPAANAPSHSNGDNDDEDDDDDESSDAADARLEKQLEHMYEDYKEQAKARAAGVHIKKMKFVSKFEKRKLEASVAAVSGARHVDSAVLEQLAKKQREVFERPDEFIEGLGHERGEGADDRPSAADDDGAEVPVSKRAAMWFSQDIFDDTADEEAAAAAAAAAREAERRRRQQRGNLSSSSSSSSNSSSSGTSSDDEDVGDYVLTNARELDAAADAAEQSDDDEDSASLSGRKAAKKAKAERRRKRKRGEEEGEETKEASGFIEVPIEEDSDEGGEGALRQFDGTEEAAVADVADSFDDDDVSSSMDSDSRDMVDRERKKHKYGTVAERATALAIGAQLVRGEVTKHDLQDAVFNKQAWDHDDENLPSWFIEDEAAHTVVRLGPRPEEVEAIKRREKDLNARPIQKVIEAQMRKYKQTRKRAEALKQKATAIADTDASAKEKMQQIERLYRRAQKRVKKGKIYVVAHGGGKFGSDAKHGAKAGRTVTVDPRLKADKRGMSAAEKRKKAGSGKGTKRGPKRHAKRRK